MTVALKWSHKVDGVELNDGSSYSTTVPEAENGPPFDVQLTAMEARTPIFDRQQPTEGKYTFLTDVLETSASDYETKLAVLKVLYGPGPHTYERTALGEAGPRSCTVYFQGGPSIDTLGTGAVTARAIAPDPFA